MQTITIDKEFQAMIPPPTSSERELLEASIVKEGCRDSLVVWGDILVDGHNRHEICTRLGIEFQTVSREFASREDVADWIDANQLGRRNLTPKVVRFIRGRRYNRTKQQGARRDLTSGQNVHKSGTAETTAQTLAKQYGVSEKTIRRDGADAALLDHHPEVAEAVIRGEVKKSAAVQELRGEGKPKKEEVKPVPECTEAMQFAVMAMSQIDRMRKDDPRRVAALLRIKNHIIKLIGE